MLDIEGREPVAECVEESIPFHLLETAEVDVGTLFLHVDHLLHGALQLFSLFISRPGVQDVFHRVVLNLFKSVVRQAEIAVVEDVGHDFALNDVVVAVGIDAADNLPLQFGQLIAVAVTEGEQLFFEVCPHFKTDALYAECPSGEGPLAHLHDGGTHVDVDEEAELQGVKLRETIHCDGADDELLVDSVHGRRQQQFFVEHLLRWFPLAAHVETVEERTHEIVMAGIELLLLLGARFLGLQAEHGRLGDEVLEGADNPFLCEHVAQRVLLGLAVERNLTAQPCHIGIGSVGPHPLHQFLVDGVAVRVLIALFHIVEHACVVFHDAVE